MSIFRIDVRGVVILGRYYKDLGGIHLVQMRFWVAIYVSSY